MLSFHIQTALRVFKTPLLLAKQASLICPRSGYGSLFFIHFRLLWHDFQERAWPLHLRHWRCILYENGRRQIGVSWGLKNSPWSNLLYNIKLHWINEYRCGKIDLFIDSVSRSFSRICLPAQVSENKWIDTRRQTAEKKGEKDQRENFWHIPTGAYCDCFGRTGKTYVKYSRPVRTVM